MARSRSISASVRTAPSGSRLASISRGLTTRIVTHKAGRIVTHKAGKLITLRQQRLPVKVVVSRVKVIIRPVRVNAVDMGT